MKHNKNIMLTIYIYIYWNLQITLNLFKIIYFVHRKRRIPRICVRSASLQNVNKAFDSMHRDFGFKITIYP